MIPSELLGCPAEPPTLRERRRGAILDAAEALFLEQGYDRTSLAEIVKRSGGSLATLYDLFGNKQGLLHAIASRWGDETALEPVDRTAAPHQSNAEVLTRYARRQCEMMRSPRAVALMRMLISESLRDREFALQIYRDLHIPAVEELSALFAGWAAAGEAQIDDPEAAAKLLLSIVIGDSMLHTLAGLDDEWLDNDQLDWRLRPFLAHFKIA
ncbi:TetR/AcrR family transcriptional regulator [Sphingopyxis sp.]|jgi:TetR/AcrR family transcriptional repressor of mexJK operon|uniref:TetR/AcrR family transcriptional regulator n=1 Tax=Sphingopyxis sp. TaxID=1908224 RepID=UPI003F6ED37B